MNICKVLKALSNERRLQILKWLKHPTQHFSSVDCNIDECGVCVGLIEKKIGLCQSTVSQYLQQLQEADLITMERCGQWTYCKLKSSTIEEFIVEMKQFF